MSRARDQRDLPQHYFYPVFPWHTCSSMAVSPRHPQMDEDDAEASRLSLIPSLFSNGTRALFVYRSTEGCPRFRIRTRWTSAENPLHTESETMFFYPERDPVLPFYTIVEGERQEWAIEIGYDQGKSPVP